MQYQYSNDPSFIGSPSDLVLQTAKCTAQVMARGGEAFLDMLQNESLPHAFRNDLVLAILKTLEEMGYNISEIVNYCREDQKTPLHIAAENNNIILAQLLIDYGADISATNIEGRSPLDLALTRESSNLVAQYLYWLGSEEGEYQCNEILMSLPDRYDIYGRYLKDLKASIQAGYGVYEEDAEEEAEPQFQTVAESQHHVVEFQPAIIVNESELVVSADPILEERVAAPTEVMIEFVSEAAVSIEPDLSSTFAPLPVTQSPSVMPSSNATRGFPVKLHRGKRAKKPVQAGAGAGAGAGFVDASESLVTVAPTEFAISKDLEDSFNTSIKESDFNGLMDILRVLEVNQVKVLMKQFGSKAILDALIKIEEPGTDHHDNIRIIECLQFYGAKTPNGFFRRVGEINRKDGLIGAPLAKVVLLEGPDSLSELNARKLIFAVKNNLNNLVIDLAKNKQEMKNAIEAVFDIWENKIDRTFDIKKIFQQVYEAGFNIFKEREPRFGAMFAIVFMALANPTEYEELIKNSLRALFEIDEHKFFAELTTKYEVSSSGGELMNTESSDGKTILEFLHDKKYLKRFIDHFDEVILAHQYGEESLAANALDNNFKALLIVFKIRGIDLAADGAIAGNPIRVSKLNALFPPQTTVVGAATGGAVGSVDKDHSALSFKK